jgi:hypothetical protein
MRQVSLHDTQTECRIRPHTLDYSSARPRTTGYEPLSLKKIQTINTSTFICRVEVIVTEKCLPKPGDYHAFCRVSNSGCCTSPVQSERLRLLIIAIQDITSYYRMTSTTITITKFNGTKYAYRATEMAILLVQKQVFGIIKQ